MQKVVDEARAKGAQAVVLLSHNGMDVDLKMASRVTGIDVILGGHTHDGVPRPTIVANRSGKTVVTNAGSNGKFLAVLDLDVSGGKVADFRYRLLPVFSSLLPPDRAMADLHPRRARAVRGETRRKARGHRGPPLSPRQFQRNGRPADPRRADGGKGCADRVLAGIPLGHGAAAGAGDTHGRPDGPDGDHLSVRHRQRIHRARRSRRFWRTSPTTCSIPTRITSRAATWCASAACPMRSTRAAAMGKRITRMELRASRSMPTQVQGRRLGVGVGGGAGPPVAKRSGTCARATCARKRQSR